MEPGHEEATAAHASTPSTGSAPEPIQSPSIESARGPRTMDHDSLVTVRLSEPPPALAVNTSFDAEQAAAPYRKSMFGGVFSPRRAVSGIVVEGESATAAGSPECFDTEASAPGETGRNLPDDIDHNDDPSDDGSSSNDERAGDTAGSEEEDDDDDESDPEEVDWVKLQQSENEHSKDQDSDNTALLLARLEQENAKFAASVKNPKVKMAEKTKQSERRPRPPSMAQLRDMVTRPAPPALRYSMVLPPPMTDLEFYAALVKDYQQTAARLPTLLSNKIRRGVPPPLRGVVWQSMSSARDSNLEDQFERYTGETSPYEGLIGKDLGRSFPGVDMFRDPEGDGQRMLGRVLRCYSLHDRKIGYCQGLAFLVGPLLMHMPDHQAFCVLVKLMENYDLRSCFLPDLSGLHVRIYQFRGLLRQILPALFSHLDELQVDPAYASQWFLSFFAVTCPLPMLFRIYDVVFAEGVSETIMRVALSLMRKNQGRILACTEMGDALQLLLSRGLWDCYHYNADEFVEDFTSLSSVVTRERLQALEQGHREAQIANNASANAARSADLTTAASRFVGRLLATTTSGSATSSSPKTPTSNTTLSPGLAAPSRPVSMLRRSLSKQSLASTLNSVEAASSCAASVLSSASTEATCVSRDSSNTDDSSTRESNTTASNGQGHKSIITSSHSHRNTDAKYLHSQIEDLLTALSELQRQHALLSDQLQRERENRDEDKKAVRSLLDGLRKKASTETVTTARSGSSEETITAADESTPSEEKDVELVNGGSGGEDKKQADHHTREELSELLNTVEERFGTRADNRRSAITQTKAQLRDEVARAKDQLATERFRTQECNRRTYDLEQEVNSLKDQIRESHTRVRNLHSDKQRLEKQVQGMRARTSAEAALTADSANEWPGKLSAGSPPNNSGLREFKLGRSQSTPSQTMSGSRPASQRSSSLLMVRGPGDKDLTGALTPPAHDNEALLLELVQAKTAEAIAKQEAEEAKQKLESLRKALGLAPGDMLNVTASASSAASTTMGMFGRLAGSVSAETAPSKTGTPVTTGPVNPSTGGGFWGWRR